MENLLHTPEGVRDIYDDECKKKLKVLDKLHHVLSLHSYSDIETPTFEFFDIFNQDKGSATSNEMYKFFDRENNTLVLRPDITPGIARCVAKYYNDEAFPIRLCYQGKTFFNTRGHQGKLNEITQIGCELINDDSSAADAEVIATAIDCFKASGFTEFQIEIGEVEFFKGVIGEASLTAEEEDEIRKCIYTSNAVESVNSALRKVTRGKGAFPNENSVFKVMYLRLKELSEKWKKPIPNWKTIQPQLIELFGDRYMKHLKI